MPGWKLVPGQAWERRGKSPVSLLPVPHGLPFQPWFAPSASRACGPLLEARTCLPSLGGITVFIKPRDFFLNLI